jgi:hypothetical protein
LSQFALSPTLIKVIYISWHRAKLPSQFSLSYALRHLQIR